MKKRIFLWVAALFAVSALFLIGCPTDDPPPDTGEGEFAIPNFPDTPSKQDKSSLSYDATTKVITITFSGAELWGELINSAGYDASAYSGIKFDYRSSGGSGTIFLQDTEEVYIFTDGSNDGWDWIPESADWTTGFELPFAHTEGQGWISGVTGNQPKLSNTLKLMFQINNYSTTNKKFEIRNLTFY